MAYQSEADQWRTLFEQQKRVAVEQTLMSVDLREWNMRLAEETLRVREANRELRIINWRLCQAFYAIAYFVILATIWNVIS